MREAATIIIIIGIVIVATMGRYVAKVQGKDQMVWASISGIVALIILTALANLAIYLLQ